MVFVAGFFVIITAFLIDKKITLTLSEIREQRSKSSFIHKPHSTEKMLPSNSISFGLKGFKGQLEKAFDKLSFSELILNDAVHLFKIRLFKPLAQIFLAIIDLKSPNLEILITSKFGKKFLTSSFAKQNGAFLAINGEAGNSPDPDSGLGWWVGNWISKGKPVLLKDTVTRPFLSFNKKNKATYFPEKIVDTALGPEKYNTIWGRYDILVDGKIVHFKYDQKQPRTIMGINSSGDLLYLMVIDGRQPKYSNGLGLMESAEILKIFGSTNAMACDQGGSSTMYVQTLGGVINRPCDVVGERPTYSHFGIRISTRKDHK